MKRTLWICGRPWLVTCDMLHIEEDDRGRAESHKQVIQVARSSCVDVQASTLLHETLHADLGSTVNRHPSDEEECVQAHECALFSIFRDKRNKWFIDVMTGKTKL